MPGASAGILHAALRQILRWALKERWIGWDVAPMVSPPRHRPQKRPPVPLEHLARILAGFQGTRWFPLIAVAFATGLRAGELLGLRWVDVDWHQKALWICRALKKPGDSPVFGSRKNDEEVPVAVHDRVLEILRQHKEFQDAERTRYNKEDWGLVFAATDGSPVDASNFLDRWWHPVLQTFIEPGQEVVIPAKDGNKAPRGRLR